MIKKKLYSIFLIVIILLSCMVPVLAQEDNTREIFKDTGMERIAGGKFLYWGDSSVIGYTEEQVHGGKYALTITGTGYASQRVFGIVGGTEYVVRGWYKSDGSVSFVLKLQWWNKDEQGNQVILEQGDADTSQNTKIIKGWTSFAARVTAPEGATFADFLFRNFGGGTLILDDLSAVGLLEETEDIPMLEKAVKVPMQGFEESLIPNGSFEQMKDEVEPEGVWGCYKSPWKDNPYVAIVKDDSHSGENAAFVTAPKSGLNPWVNYVTELEPGAKYQMRFWYKWVTGSGYAAIKLEYYNDTKVAIETSEGYNQSPTYKATDGMWKQEYVDFVAGENSVYLAAYLRLYGVGSVLFDDVSLYKINDPKEYELDTDQVFYYTENKHQGKAKITKTKYAKTEAASIAWSLNDGNTVLKSETVSFTEEDSFFYPMRLLSEKGKEYLVTADVLDASGNVITTQKQKICKYDRPKYLNEKGEFVKNGTVINPIFSYHHSHQDWGVGKEAGINLVQQYSTSNIQGEELHNLAKEEDMMLLANMYFEMKPPGYPESSEEAKKTVEEYKDNDALLAYMVMDEPYLNFSDPEELLYDSYKLIRDIDPDHPIYIVDTPGSHLETVAKYCDIIAIDPYIGANGNDEGAAGEDGDFSIGTHIINQVREADINGLYGKPIYSLLQMFDFMGYFPTPEEARNMIYQNFFAGAAATGYYCFEDSKPGVNLDETEIWDTLKNFGQNEAEEAFDAFVNYKYPVFTEQETENTWIKVFEKEGKLRAFAMNKTFESQTITLPLTSFDGAVAVEGYSGAIDEGGTISGNQTLTITLPAMAVYRITIIPDKAIDTSKLTTMQFVDLYNYPWARTQIERLAAQNKVNNITYRTFAPGKNITRGELALFLVRTLGLIGDTSDTFSDIDPDAEYAKEVAIGKSLGILNGIGDGKYNPEAEITRQDLMTIIARAMKLSEKADLSNFTDGSIVADYAKHHVAAMVAAGLVKGNADGTLNPLGNTTRAEAAVIMDRILNS